MRKLLVLVFVLLLLPGCVSSLAGAAVLDPDDVAEMVTLMKDPPAAQIELDMIFAYGEINSLECLKTIEGRSGQ